MVDAKVIVMLGIAAAMVGCASFLGVNMSGETETNSEGVKLGATFGWTVTGSNAQDTSKYVAWVSPEHQKVRVQMQRITVESEIVFADDMAETDENKAAIISAHETGTIPDVGGIHEHVTTATGTFNMIFDITANTFDEHDVSTVVVAVDGVDNGEGETAAPKCTTGNEIEEGMLAVTSINDDSVDEAVIEMANGDQTTALTALGKVIGFRTDREGDVVFDFVEKGVIDDNVFDAPGACRRILAEKDPEQRLKLAQDDQERLAIYMSGGNARKLEVIRAQIAQMRGESPEVEEEGPLPVENAIANRKLLSKRKLGFLDMPGMQYCGPDIEGKPNTNGVKDNGNGYNFPVCSVDEACNFHDNACWRNPPSDWGRKGKGARSSAVDQSRVSHSWCAGAHDGMAENCLCSNTLRVHAGAWKCATSIRGGRIPWYTALWSGGAVKVAFSVLPCWSGHWWSWFSCSGCSGCSGCGWGGCSGCSGCSGCWSTRHKYSMCYFPPSLSGSYYSNGKCTAPNGGGCGNGQ